MKLIFTLFIIVLHNVFFKKILAISRIPENALVVVTFTVSSISPVRLSFMLSFYVLS